MLSLPSPKFRYFTSAAVIAMLGPGAWGGDHDGIGFFERKIRPVLVEHCYECHTEAAASAGKLRGGLRLDSRQGLLLGGDSGPALVPGDAEQSLLLSALRHDGLEMPPDRKLPDAVIADFTYWVQLGAPDPRDTPENQGPSYSPLAPPPPLWSLQPLRPQPLPSVRQTQWPRNRIDHFVLAQLERSQLSPAPPAPSVTLTRRASFDLRGLPPSLCDLRTPIENESYVQLIERYLSSPEFGVRWGRVWLDLARYADETEDWIRFPGTPYLYRDWVIRAHNQDMPYPEFVQLQLAADLMPDVPPPERAALGFLGLGPQYWKELALAPDVIRKIVADEWDERVDTVSSTFLGLTVACARCHDHKFDPITMQDYYAFAGVFASTQSCDQPVIETSAYAEIRQARVQIADLEKQVEELNNADRSTDTAQRVDNFRKRITQIQQAHPQLNAVTAVAGVKDAAVHVVPDGPHRTRLDYRDGESLDLAVFIRGNPENRGMISPRRFLTALSPTTPPAVFGAGSGRQDLAQALFRDASALTARVIVNRVWLEHFGRGLVDTPSNLGRNGDPPSHPELLDDLAFRFVEHGWSLKWLHREIMTSATYCQSSHCTAAAHSLDPENRQLGRMPRRRLPIEAWRDALLTASGELDRSLGGPSHGLDDPLNRRRTVYGTIRRTELHELLRLHDFPSAEAHSPRRIATTTPLQQLFAMNSEFMSKRADAFLQRIAREAPDTTDQRIHLAYELAFGRKPTSRELQIGRTYLEPEQGLTSARWYAYLQAILGSNEFLYID